MAVIFDPVAFRQQFPSFQCTPPVADASLQGWFDLATAYISNRNCGNYRRIGGMSTAQKTQALYLMTAHLGTIARSIEAGDTVGVLTAATVDKVSVTLEPPPAPNQWQYWLNSTPYGQQLLALLQVVSVGGLYINPKPTLLALRIF